MNNGKSNLMQNTSLVITSVCMFFITMVLFVFIYKQTVGYSNSNGLRRNMFYVNIINYTMPEVRVVSFNEEDMAENEMSLKKTISNVLGISIDDPFTIIHREMASLNLVPFSGDVNSQYANEDIDTGNSKDNTDDSTDTIFDLGNEVVEKGDKENKIDVSSKSVFNASLVKPLSEVPEVLIYHTHTSESFKPGKANSTDQNVNICSVGEELKKQLEAYGISVIHDTTVHDRDVYIKSYERSSVTLDKYLKKYGDFKLIIDMHRDAVVDKNAITARLNNEDLAKIMFVMTKKNPHFSENMKNVNSLMEISNKLFPGFCKGVYYYNYGSVYFNQNDSVNALLVEVGSHVNTTNEAKTSSKYIARIIAEHLNGKN